MGAAPSQPPQSKRPTPLILGVLGGGGLLLLCLCAVIGFTILARVGDNTTASSGSSATETTRASGAAPIPGRGGGAGGGALPGGGAFPRGSALPVGSTRPGTGGVGASTAPGRSGSSTGLESAIYLCFPSDGQDPTGILIVDDSNYTDADELPGTYSYNAATKTITWQSGSYQQYTGYFVDEGDTAFGSPATAPKIYNRNKSGSGTPFDNKTPESAFIGCDLFAR